MKVAICFSGVCEWSVDKNIERIQKKLQFDCFYSTWKECESTFNEFLPNKTVVILPQPVMNYHPFIDAVPTATSLLPEPFQSNLRRILKGPINKSKQIRQQVESGKLDPNSWTATKYQNGNKQILSHAYLVQSIPPEYDMIIRVRYDTVISTVVDFASWLDISFNTQSAVGFAIMPRGKVRRKYSLNKLVRASTSNEVLGQTFLMDHLIMHPRNIFDVERVKKLHTDKQLLPHEFGWWQTLSFPHNNHTNIHGGAGIEQMHRGVK